MAKLAQWKQYTPLSAVMREETAHLSPIQLRIEDYYLLRTSKVNESASSSINYWIKKKCFNG